ncbi:hypothetical protein B8A12_12975 [Staphylococcus aureus]|nr:hypothetical protein B8A12_12975 [Staphylococcus aureus]
MGVISVEIGVPISLCWGSAVNYYQYKIVEPTIWILCPGIGFANNYYPILQSLVPEIQSSYGITINKNFNIDSIDF